MHLRDRQMRILLSFVVAYATAALIGPVSTAGDSPEHPAGTTAQAPAPGEYAWAPSCRKCHEEVYEVWAATKHARALNRLSDADQARECVGCHVTGAKTKIEQDGKTVNAGVQCESCHGAAAAHVADPAVKTGLAKRPPAAACTTCHNDRSPNFRGFFYDAMWPLSHKLKR